MLNTSFISRCFHNSLFKRAYPLVSNELLNCWLLAGFYGAGVQLTGMCAHIRYGKGMCTYWLGVYFLGLIPFDKTLSQLDVN